MPEVYQVTLKLLVVSHEDPLIFPPQSWELPYLVANAIELESSFVEMVPADHELVAEIKGEE